MKEGKCEAAYNKMEAIAEGGKGKLSIKEVKLAWRFYSEGLFGQTDRGFDRELNKAIVISMKRGASKNLMIKMRDYLGYPR